MKVDVAIITALRKELDAILHQYSSWQTVNGRPKSIRRYHITKNESGLRIAAVQAQRMGQVNASLIASDVLADCSPQIILLIGIAAGIGNDINLGDVVVSDQLIDYEIGKLTDSGEFPRFPVYKSSAALLAQLTNFKDHEWTRRITKPRPDGIHTTLPIAHPPGDVFCGNKVVADSKTISRLLGHFPKAIALEMESIGIASRLEQIGEPPGFAMIKGICDKGDPLKGDGWQEYAADVAAAYTASFLEQIELIGGGKRIRAKNDDDIEEETAHIIDFVASDPVSLQSFQHDLVKQIVKASLREVNDILLGRYQANLGHGQQFLLRAKALFGNATSIYATNLDTVSTFWTNTSNRYEAREYLKHQAPNGKASRLFVFSDADSAHNHANILDWHDHSYGNVFICSLEQYRRFLDEVCGSMRPDQLLNRDFAVLQYENKGLCNNIFAALDDKSLEYQEIYLDQPGEIDYKAYIGAFHRYLKLERGQLDQHSSVLRWQEGFWKDKERWADILKKMFTERESDVFHIVVFKYDPNIESLLRQNLAEIKKKILCNTSSSPATMRNKYGIKDVWFGERKLCEARDYLHKGRLKMSENNGDTFILMLQFNNQDGLQRFYEDKEHADLRKKLYELFDNRFSIMYEATESGLLASENRKSIAGEFIESMAQRYISRYDYQNSEMIREMVMTTDPFAF
ncbi:MAG: hypothetical protein ACK55E_15925 [Cyanobacteriota bacterium]|jgi:adenosylhomocysteine nucleosidase